MSVQLPMFGLETCEGTGGATSSPADERAGAWMGLCDWVLEETILRLEEKG